MTELDGALTVIQAALLDARETASVFELEKEYEKYDQALTTIAAIRDAFEKADRPHNNEHLEKAQILQRITKEV